MSQRYKVTSDYVVGHDKGDLITADDLPAGVNLDALVASKHLAKAATPKTTSSKDK